VTPASFVIVEFYGPARMRAGRTELAVSAVTVRAALKQVASTCPGLAHLLQADGRLAPEYLLSIDGTRFLTDLNEPLHSGERLLLLGADAGG
jgi:hypothetical protein